MRPKSSILIMLNYGAATESRPYKEMEKFEDCRDFKNVGAGLCAVSAPAPLQWHSLKTPEVELPG